MLGTPDRVQQVVRRTTASSVDYVPVVCGLDASTCSRDTLTQIKNWFNECSRDHECHGLETGHNKNWRGSTNVWTREKEWRQPDEKETREPNADQATGVSKAMHGELPARLIHVGASDDQRDLFIQNVVPDNCRVPYVTLSHCWGSPEGPCPLMLTSGNASKLSHGIPFNDLPKTFADTVEVIRELGVKYLWIDSLCINQSPTQDWRTKPAKIEGI